MRHNTTLLVLVKLAILALLIGGTGELTLSKWERWQRGPVLSGPLLADPAAADGFEQQTGGIWTSTREGGRLAFVLNAHKHLVQVSLQLQGKVNTPVLLKVYGPDGHEIRRLEAAWQKRLRYSPYSFMSQAVFEVHAKASRLEVVADGPGLSMSTVQAIEGNKYDWGRMQLLMGLAFLCLVGAYALATGRVQVEVLAICTALTCGVILAAWSPLTYVSWDESIHYRNTDMRSWHSVAPQPVKDVFWRSHVLASSYSKQEQDQINTFFDQLPAAPPSTSPPVQRSVFDPLFSWYRTVGYLPAATGLFIGRLMELPNHEVFRLGRVSNLLFYALVVFAAVKLAPVGKLTMANVALLPTAVFLAAHYSYDPWVTCMGLLGLSVFLKVLLREQGTVHWLEKLALVGAPFLAVGPKAIYCLIILLPLLLPARKFGSPAAARRFKLGVVAAFLYALSSFVLPFLVQGPGKGDSRGGAGVNSTEQVAYVLSHPLQYAQDLLLFLAHYLNPLNMQALAVHFGEMGAVTGFTAALVLVGLAVVGDVLSQPPTVRPRSNWWPARAVVLLGVLSTVALIASALYVSFTPVGYRSINGVQSRYLIPLLPLTLLSLMPLTSKRQGNFYLIGQLTSVLPILMGLVTLLAIWAQIVSKYY